MAASRDGAPAARAHRDRVPMASMILRGMRRGAPRAVAHGRAQGHRWPAGTSHGGAVDGSVSLSQAYHPAYDGRGVWRTDAWGDDRPSGAGHDRGGRRARRGSPPRRPRARRGPPRCDELAPRGQASLVMGGGDKLGDGVWGPHVTRGPRGSRAVGCDVVRHLGAGSLSCVPRVSGAVAAAVRGALAAGLCSDARPCWSRRGGR